jgi:hypothetical protein
VGAAIASGSQVKKGTCADFAHAEIKKNINTKFLRPGERELIAEKSKEPVLTKIITIDMAKKMPPPNVINKALNPALSDSSFL